MKKCILSAIVIMVFSLSLMAQTRTPRPAQSQANQQSKIQQTKKAAKADGTITPQERAKIHRQQNKASDAINNQKHDTQRR
jgi:uncharacterized membrane protein YebE (DUF533 family)